MKHKDIKISIDLSIDNIKNSTKRLLRKNNWLIIIFIFLFSAILYAAGDLQKIYTFSAGDPIVADEINTNFDMLIEELEEITGDVERVGAAWFESEIEDLNREISNKVSECILRANRLEGVDSEDDESLEETVARGTIFYWSGNTQDIKDLGAGGDGQTGFWEFYNKPEIRSRFIAGAYLQRSDEDVSPDDASDFIFDIARPSNIYSAIHTHELFHQHKETSVSNPDTRHKHRWLTLREFKASPNTTLVKPWEFETWDINGILISPFVKFNTEWGIEHVIDFDDFIPFLITNPEPISGNQYYYTDLSNSHSQRITSTSVACCPFGVACTLGENMDVPSGYANNTPSFHALALVIRN